MSDKQQIDKGRIAFYLPSLRGGGAERVMVTIANGFAKQGYKVDLVLANAVGPYLDEVSENVRIVDLESRRVAFSLPGLCRYIRKAKPLALYSAMRHANVIAALACRLASVGTRLIISERNALSASDWQQEGLRAHILKALMRRAYLFADKIVAVSFGVADDLAAHLDLPRDIIEVIYNPISVDNIIAAIESSMPYPWFPTNGIRIVAAGRLTRQKGFLDLIRAFAILRKTKKASLIILGEGNQRRELEAEAEILGISSDVFLPGFIKNPFPLIAKADLFVLSSQWEGLPNVLIQAMACGTPVISSNCPFGPAEILENGKWGMLVTPGDINELAHAMNATINAEIRPDVLVRAGHFNVSIAVNSYLNLVFDQ
jgi:glycosyltransferase involved in cell wall biosynthesis